MLRELLRELLQGLTVVLLDKTTPNHVAYLIPLSRCCWKILSPQGESVLQSISDVSSRSVLPLTGLQFKNIWFFPSCPLPRVRQLSGQTDARYQEPLGRKWLRLSPRMRARVASTMSSSSGIKSPDDTGVLTFGPGPGARAPVNPAALFVQLPSAH